MKILKVLKFGGTSVQSAASMRQVANCIKKDDSNRVVVVLSAVSGVTDALLKAVNLSIHNLENSLKIIAELRLKHVEILHELTENQPSESEKIIINIFDEITNKLCAFNALGEITPQNIDSVQSYGELLSTNIFCKFLNHSGIESKFLDIREIIKTNSNFTCAEVDFGLSLKEINNKFNIFKDNNIIITQGFIAVDEKKRTTTLGRGGSDYSASVLGKLLKSAEFDVEEIQIWTDVDGVLTADPRIIRHAKTIDILSPNEVRVLSYLGAKVLHPDTIKPAVEVDIPVRVMNTFNPDSNGTLITDMGLTSRSEVHSIVSIGRCNLLKIIVPPALNAWSFCGRVSEIAQLGNCKPIFMNVTDNELSLYFKNNVDIFLNSKLAETIEISDSYLIALTGCRLTEFGNEIINHLEFGLNIIGISDSALYINSDIEISQNLLNELHNRIFIN